ncbi:carboxy-cis,cis-muconate cyclase [Hypoxylon sp. FL1284]|nr:carboxy-cis,cis-muconate cyclase [Hypoxylon sp. FL1284]
MHCIQALSFLASCAALAEAAKHQLIVGTFSTKFLYTVEYDDTAETLELVKTTPTDAASSWISFSHDKKNLYGTDWASKNPSFVSYSVSDASTLSFEARLESTSAWVGEKSVFVQASPAAPHAVYGSYFYGNAKCGTVMSVHVNGTLRAVVQDFAYADGSAVHGVAFSTADDDDARYLYSADDNGNSLWVHEIAQGAAAEGTLGTARQRVRWPETGAGPRHLVAHPAGAYVYAVLEGASQVAEVAVVAGSPPQLQPTGRTFPLLRDGDDKADFWADEVALSAPQGRYLWASSRARSTTRRGYISALEVDEATGELGRQLFLAETSSSGGFANAVAPSPFDDGLVALTDNSTGFVEVWRMDGGGAGAAVVAHLDIDDSQGCCANAVWYS